MTDLIIVFYYFNYSKTGKAEELGEKQLAAMEAAEKLASSKSTKVEGPSSAIDFGGITKMIVSFLARNFFTLKLIALVIAFTINFMLLFYKVTIIKINFFHFINYIKLVIDASLIKYIYSNLIYGHLGISFRGRRR